MSTLACTTIPRNGHQAPAVIPQGQAHLPEAACSVNGFFTVNGWTRDFQATGRGATPQEAAHNLKATMVATQEALAPIPPPTREERLASLLACGLTRAVSKGDTGLVERLAKAAALVLSDAVEPTERVQAMAVRSAHQPDTWYTIEGISCSCPDWERHREEGGYCCKHRLAVWMHRKLGAE